MLVSFAPFIFKIQTLRLVKILHIVGIIQQGLLQIVLKLLSRVRVSISGSRLEALGLAGAPRHRVQVLLSEQWIGIELAFHL